jgi:hypothetical protein
MRPHVAELDAEALRARRPDRAERLEHVGQELLGGQAILLGPVGERIAQAADAIGERETRSLATDRAPELAQQRRAPFQPHQGVVGPHLERRRQRLARHAR